MGIPLILGGAALYCIYKTGKYLTKKREVDLPERKDYDGNIYESRLHGSYLQYLFQVPCISCDEKEETKWDYYNPVKWDCATKVDSELCPMFFNRIHNPNCKPHYRYDVKYDCEGHFSPSPDGQYYFDRENCNYYRDIKSYFSRDRKDYRSDDWDDFELDYVHFVPRKDRRYIKEGGPRYNLSGITRKLSNFARMAFRDFRETFFPEKQEMPSRGLHRVFSDDSLCGD